jgi:uncharacterized protein YraI
MTDVSHSKEPVMNRIVASLASLAFCAPLLASAADGYVVADISLQAGPDPAYPSIVELSTGTPVAIQGCLDGWNWCDVIAVGERGWVPGTFLQEDYGGQRVIVTDYGPRIGIPIIAFSIGAYWDRHYHDRPFYSQRQQWESRGITVHAPPRPSNVATTARPATKAIPQDKQHAGAAEQAQHQTPAPATAPGAAAQRATAEQQRAASERATHERVAKATNPAVQQKQQQQKPEAQPESAPAKPSDQAPQMKPAEHPATKPVASAKQKEEPKAKPKAQEPKPKDELQAPKKKDDNKDNGGG